MNFAVIDAHSTARSRLELPLRRRNRNKTWLYTASSSSPLVCELISFVSSLDVECGVFAGDGRGGDTCPKCYQNDEPRWLVSSSSVRTEPCWFHVLNDSECLVAPYFSELASCDEETASAQWITALGRTGAVRYHILLGGHVVAELERIPSSRARGLVVRVSVQSCHVTTTSTTSLFV